MHWIWIIPVVIIGLVLLRWLWRQLRIRRFHVVTRGVLYRGGQPTLMALWLLARVFKVRLVINLREDFKENEKLYGMDEVRILIPPRTNLPTLEQCQEFLRLVRDDSNRPVLAHCKVGANRTGFMIALWRVIEEGWPIDDALSEMARVRGGAPPEATQAHFRELIGQLRTS